MSIFDELRAHAALDFQSGRVLPLEAYRSEEVLAAERTAVFANAWICVGRTADLPRAGDEDHLSGQIPPDLRQQVPHVRRHDVSVRLFSSGVKNTSEYFFD